MDQRSLRGSADARQQQWLDLGPTRPTDGDARAVRQEQLSSEMPSALNFASSVRSSGWRRRSSVAIAADGLRWLESLDMCTVSAHIATLTARLLDRLRALGDRIHVYGPRDAHGRGGIVTFNVVRDGRALPYERVEATARELGLAIRAGCFCNPGAAEHAFGIPAQAARACLRDEFSVARFRRCLDGSAAGAVRASVGVATNDDDLDRLLECIQRVLSQRPS